MSSQIDQTILYNNVRNFFYKFISSIDEERLDIFLNILKDYDDNKMSLLQAYRNCYYVIPNDLEFREFTTLYNQLLPEQMRIYDNNNKPSTDEFKTFLEHIKRCIPDQRENFTNMLLNKSLTQEDKLLRLKDITQDHPDIFEKIKNYCQMNSNDVDNLPTGSGDDREEVKEIYTCDKVEVEQLLSPNRPQSHNSLDEGLIVEDEPSNFSIKPDQNNQNLSEIAPRLSVIMSGLNIQNKLFDKSECVCFESLFKVLRNKYEDIIKVLFLYDEGVLGADEIDILLKEYFANETDLSDEFQNLLYSREVSRRSNSWFTKSISEFSLANCKIIDKSYTMFPAEFPVQICSGKDEICSQVLNEKYVSVPRGSEFFSFHIKNQNEELLFVTEDELYELDNYIGMTESTIMALINLK